MEGAELKTFKRSNPDSYLAVSIKEPGEFDHYNPNLYYVQIVEPMNTKHKSPTKNSSLTTVTTKKQKLTIGQRWQHSKSKELFRLAQ